MTLTARVDALQQRRPWLGLPIAVVYKFTDDQGGYLAALITYYGFLSLFPLLLLAITVLGFLLSHDPSLRERILTSALRDFPLVGNQLGHIRTFRGSGAAVVVGLLGSAYGGLGVAQAGQNAMNQVWAVPRNRRPNPLKARGRSVVLLLLLGVGVLLTTALSGLSTGAQSFAHDLAGLDEGVRVLAVVLAVALNIVLFVAAFRLLTVLPVTVRDVAPGAVVAALLWQVLQAVGTYYLGHKIRGATEVYGTFGFILGLIGWIYLEAVIVVLCAELNVVLRRRLWPRALLTPFTDAVSLTGADEQVYGGLATAQRSKGFERVDVSFDDPPAQDTTSEPTSADEPGDRPAR
jgi:YihY family inner membrane protein